MGRSKTSPVWGRYWSSSRTSLWWMTAPGVVARFFPTAKGRRSTWDGKPALLRRSVRRWPTPRHRLSPPVSNARLIAPGLPSSCLVGASASTRRVKAKRPRSRLFSSRSTSSTRPSRASRHARYACIQRRYTGWSRQVSSRKGGAAGGGLGLAIGPTGEDEGDLPDEAADPAGELRRVQEGAGQHSRSGGQGLRAIEADQGVGGYDGLDCLLTDVLAQLACEVPDDLAGRRLGSRRRGIAPRGGLGDGLHCGVHGRLLPVVVFTSSSAGPRTGVRRSSRPGSGRVLPGRLERRTP